MGRVMDETQASNAIPESSPFALFDDWFALARDKEPNDPEAVALYAELEPMRERLIEIEDAQVARTNASNGLTIEEISQNNEI